MSIVIVGGNDCMVRQYKDLCEQYACRAKVFTQVPKGFRDKIGTPETWQIGRASCRERV